MDTFWDYSLLGNTVKHWLIAVLVSIVLIGVVKLCEASLLRKIKKFTDRSRSTLDDFAYDVIKRTVVPLFYFLAVYIPLTHLELHPEFYKWLRFTWMLTIIFFVIRTITDFISYLFSQYAKKGYSPSQQARGLIIIIKIVLWIAGVVFLADNLGYNITTIVAGLGIGGIAIALAGQAILADLFSYFVIFFDKPFETGDYIVVGDKSGIVEHIGIKTTRLRTLTGEQLIMSNTDLTNSRVQNYKRMEKRRVVITIGVTYETRADILVHIPAIIEEIVSDQEDVLFDRAHFKGFGNFSLDFEIVFFMLTDDYVKYMDRQQEFCLRLLERFEQENIEFAYPTQKLFVVPQGNLTT